MKKLSWGLISFLFLVGCVKDYNSITATYFKNETAHKIEVVAYSNGGINSADSKTILANQDLQVYSQNVKGKTLEPNYGTLLQPNDSIVVIFDDTIKITHLKFNSTIQSGHYIWFTDARSISNPNSYIKTIDKETKNHLEGNFRYTFTEQDYQFAKN